MEIAISFAQFLLITVNFLFRSFPIIAIMAGCRYVDGYRCVVFHSKLFMAAPFGQTHPASSSKRCHTQLPGTIYVLTLCFCNQPSRETESRALNVSGDHESSSIPLTNDAHNYYVFLLCMLGLISESLNQMYAAYLAFWFDVWYRQAMSPAKARSDNQSALPEPCEFLSRFPAVFKIPSKFSQNDKDFQFFKRICSILMEKNNNFTCCPYYVCDFLWKSFASSKSMLCFISIRNGISGSAGSARPETCHPIPWGKGSPITNALGVVRR